MRLDGRSDDLVGSLVVCQVDDYRDDAVTDRRHRAFDSVDTDHEGTLVGQGPQCRLAYASGCAGHHNDLVFQSELHVVPSIVACCFVQSSLRLRRS